MKTILNQAEGKKSYLIGAGIIIYAILGLLLGKVDQNTAIIEILNGFGIMAIRHGISKIG